MRKSLVRLYRCAGWYAFFLALVLVASAFLLQGDIGLGLSDEGYLWYGAVRTAAGDIPIKDFRSYDPGRYYWIAAWSFVFGQGIMALRLSVALFQVLGLTFGLLAANRVVKSWWALGLVGGLLLVWMQPRYKLFESSLAMMAVYVAVCLIEKPVPTRYLGAGVFVGLAAFMGRNHGLYSLAAFFLLILFIWIKQKQTRSLKHLGLWSVGIVVGYLPMLLMLILIPDMLELYLFDKILVFFDRGATNLTLPIPWPWMVDYAQQSVFGGTFHFFVGSLFLLLPLFYILVIAWSFLGKSRDDTPHPLLIASAFVGVFYMHHAFSRADLSHLAQSIPPFLLGLVALFSTIVLPSRKKWAVSLGALTLVGLGVAITLVSPCVTKLRAPDLFVRYTITGDRIWISKKQVAYIEPISQLVTRYVTPDEGLFIAPYSPALYVILHRESPVHNTYLLFPETQEKQEQMIQDLINHRVNWAIVADVGADGRDELRFRHTHPLVWQYLTSEFEPVEAPGLPDDQQFLRRKEPF